MINPPSERIARAEAAPALVYLHHPQRHGVSVIIPLTGAFHRGCVAAVAACIQRQTGTDFELVIVQPDDEPPVAEIRQWVARVPPAPGELYNVSYLRNEGVAHSRGAYLCFIDGDILLPHPHYLAQMAALHAGRDDYALAMPRRHRILRGDYDLAALVAYIRQTADWLDALEPAEDFAYRCRWDTQPAPALIFRDEPLRRVFADASQLAAQGEGGVLWQANVFGGGLWVSRAVFDLVGGYSEQFSGWGSQDLDLAERISRVCEVDMLYTSPAHDTLTVYHFEHPQDTRLQQAARNRALRQQRATQPLRALLAADMRAGFSSYVRDLARRHPWLEIA